MPTKPTALKPAQIKQMLRDLPGWKKSGKEIVREFKFKDFHETMKFVNAVAKIANRANHHPDMEVGYNRCVVRYSTHSVGGLSESDFRCAGRINAIF